MAGCMGVVHGACTHTPRPSLPVYQNPNPTPLYLYGTALHNTAAKAYKYQGVSIPKFVTNWNIFLSTEGIWNPTIWNLETLETLTLWRSDFIWPGFQMARFSNGWALTMALAIVPNHLKTTPFEIWMFLSGFQMVFDKIAAICSDFKWLGFRISKHIWNPDKNIQISNGVVFKCNPTSCWPFQIQTSWDFISPVYEL